MRPESCFRGIPALLRLTSVRLSWRNFISPELRGENWSREPYTTPFVISTLGLSVLNLCAKFAVPVFTRYGNTKGIVKCIKYRDIGG